MMQYAPDGQGPSALLNIEEIQGVWEAGFKAGVQTTVTSAMMILRTTPTEPSHRPEGKTAVEFFRNLTSRQKNTPE